MKKRAVMFWSGGKDSALALHIIRNTYLEIEVIRLITTINADFKRISMHGVREELLDLQASSIGLPLQKMYVPNIPENTVYETELFKIFIGLKEEGIEHVVFGDIFLEDLKKYRDDALAAHGLTGIYPLWKKPTDALMQDFLLQGFRTITCCVNTKYLGEEWAGKEIDSIFLKELPQNIDPCGENGEFHTFCFNGPIFKKPIGFKTGEKKYTPLAIRQDTDNTEEVGFWYIDLLLAGSEQS